MLFCYQPVSPNLFLSSENSAQLVSAVKKQKESLKQFELAHFNEFSVYQFIENRSAFYDALLLDMWRYFQLDKFSENQPELCLLAVGGYGRQEIFPLSDLDILILSSCPLCDESVGKITQFVQCLWDCGFEVGHSVRTLTECEINTRQDITIATNLLEARYLSGQINLFSNLQNLLQKPDFWSKQDFFHAKHKEQQDRYQRYHNTSYNLEPDIKYSPGGLRDLHLLYWIALRHNGARTLEGILDSGFIYPSEYERLQKSQHFLFKVRFALHLILKRYDNRLLFERQIRVAKLLGFEGEGNLGVETMMKTFFQALQQISVLSDVIVKYYFEHFLQTESIENSQVLDRTFVLKNNRLCLQNPNAFLEQPDLMLDLFFHLTQYPQAEIHSSTLRHLQLALEHQQTSLCELPLAREKFLRLFNQPKSIARAFFPMHRYGVLNAYLTQWHKIKGLMQFDLFHCYTVDEHTLRVMLKLESFLQPESQELQPLCSQLFTRLTDRTLLYVAALFHDIAKGREGDHSILGAQDVVEFAQLHGFDQREIQTLKWLVEQHLLMSITAQRRDIHDPEVVRNFASEVRNQVRLDYLTCLTVADICATNENLWNSWKSALIYSLHQFTKKQFAQGINVLLNHQEEIEKHRQQAGQLLRDQEQPLSAVQIESIWQRFPEEYFLRNRPQQIAWHTQLLAQLDGDLLVKISNRFAGSSTEIFVYCQDQAHLFHKVATTIGAKKLSIHEAQIITSCDGYVFDTFIVTELDGSLLKYERRRSLEQALVSSLLSSTQPKFFAQRNRKLEHFKVKTDVRFFKAHREQQTAMELLTLDQNGLLAKVSRVFTELNLNLLNAKITTIGERAEDFFILSNQQGKALSETQQELLAQRLIAELDGV